MKIAHIIKSFNRGGAEVLLRETLEVNEDHDIDLIILNKNLIALLPDLKIHDRIYLFDFFSIRFIFELVRLARLIRAKKYDILHAHLPIAGFIVRLLKPIYKSFSKLVYTEHNLVKHYNLLTHILNGATYRLNDSVIFVSNETKKSVDDYKGSLLYHYVNGFVVLNGVNTMKFVTKREQKKEITVGAVASFRKQKRLDRWVDVAHSFTKMNPGKQVKFILAGDGDEREHIESLIKKYNLANTVFLTGLVTDTVAVYNQIDIFLMTSDFEGLPVALLEAMSSECVPLVTDVGGIKQMHFSDFGFKFDSFHPLEFANKILCYSRDSSMLMHEGKKARDYIIQNFSLARQINEINAIYTLVKE